MGEMCLAHEHLSCAGFQLGMLIPGSESTNLLFFIMKVIHAHYRKFQKYRKVEKSNKTL